MKQSDKLKELLEEIHKLAEESILYLPIMESLDHEEKEPLIKDEKVRKAVRAWAEANRDVYKVTYYIDYTFYRCSLKDTDSDAELVFNFTNIIGITGGTTYTIAELCGEEE